MIHDRETPNGTADDAQVPASDARPKRSTRKPRTTRRSAEERDLPIERASDASSSGADGLEAEIRRCAYDLYLARGGRGGDEVSDWLEAERMVRRPR
jgi:DUF2934 family protein